MGHVRSFIGAIAVALSVAAVANCKLQERPPPSGTESAVVGVGSGSTSGSAGGGPGGAGSGGSSGAGGDAGPVPSDLPQAQGICPTLTEGTVEVVINGTTRRAEVRMDPGSTLAGPVVVAWHGLGDTPGDALLLVGNDNIDAIRLAGGVVIAPYSDPAAGDATWFHATVGNVRDDDLLLTDELIACAVTDFGINPRRIHSVGYGEGAIGALEMAVRRSDYVASTVLHSVSFQGPSSLQDGTNTFPAMILHGGIADVTAFTWGQDSETLAQQMVISGAAAPFFGTHDVVYCDHGGAHSVAFDAIDASYRFLLDHPYKTVSSYDMGLPSEFPQYCDWFIP